MKSLSLFDDFSVAEHMEAFDGWVDTQRSLGLMRRVSSEEVYRDMWGSFEDWCCVQIPPRALDRLSVDDLAAFQASRRGAGVAKDLSPRHARRLLGLIDRVLRHHASQGSDAPNTAAADAITAQPAVRYADAADATAMPKSLSIAEATSLIVYLSQARPRPGAPAEALSWQQVRNRASVALQLGAGLTPGDVRAIETTDVVVRGTASTSRIVKIRVPGNGNTATRDAPIAPWAAELLRYWLQIRKDLAIPGTCLFPSTRTGKRWGKVAQYSAAKQVLAEAGIDEATGGSFRLRHTFALRQLRRGTSLQEVAQWLGVSDLAKMTRYQSMLGEETPIV